MRSRRTAMLSIAAGAIVVLAAATFADDSASAKPDSAEPRSSHTLSNFTSWSISSVGIAPSICSVLRDSPLAAYPPRRFGYPSALRESIEPEWFIGVFCSRNIEPIKVGSDWFRGERGYDWFREEHWGLNDALWRSSRENTDRYGQPYFLSPRR